jgi:hypothetical protein
MRLKIIAGNFLVVLIVGLLSFYIAKGEVETGLAAQVESQIVNDSKLLGRSFQLEGITFLEMVVDRAQTEAVKQAFGGLDTDSRRSRAHQAANGISQWLRDPSRRGLNPDLVVITDETGTVLARDQDPNRLHNTRLAQQIPALRTVLAAGEPAHDVWFKEDEDKVFETAIAAVRNDAGAVIGALLVGYDLSNATAQRAAELLGRDVAFISDGRVYSSSLENSESQGLASYLFSDSQSAATNAALAGTGGGNRWGAQIDGADWVGVTSALPGVTGFQVAYVVLGNKSEGTSLASSVNIVLYMSIFGALIVLVYGFIIGSSFLRPLEQIEEGVLSVINGRTDFRLDIESAEFGGLAYRINQLINVFTGVSEEDEEGRVSPSRPPPAANPDWQGSAFDTNASQSPSGGGGGGGGDVIDDPALAASLEAEPEDGYLTRVYNEYVQAKTAAGENVANIRQEVFTKRLKGQAGALAKKHGVRMVRFKVEVAGTQVSLKPVLIR